MQLPASDLSLIRQHPQSSELFLSIFQPQTVLACVVSGTVAQGSRTIPYNSVSSGSYLSVESGMTLLVGSTAGARNLGKIRVKSATATNIVVAENSHIQWANGVHLTVLRYWEVWPIYPRIINDPGNVDNVIFYKDYDVAYTNQNTILGTFPCAGEHRAIWVGEQSYWSNTGTTNLLGSTLSHNWAFEGGSSITGSTSASPGYVTYNTPGHFVTRYIVTGSNGSVDTTYRYISVYNRPENASANIPITKFSLDNLSGSRGEGGYNTNLQITDTPVDLHDGDVVVLFGEDYYGATQRSLGGNSPNNSSIFFVGHIIQDSIKYDYMSSNVDFSVGSISEIMKLTEGFSVSVESRSAPTKWFHLLDMDGRRALYHYLKWHSTVLYLADFEFKGTDQKIQYFDSDRESMFDAIDNYMRGTLLGSVCADRQGKLYAEVGAWAYSNPTGSFPTIMSITDEDLLGRPNITERLTPPLSFLELGGVAYSGSTTGTFSALISNAPGETPNTRGNTERTQGLALSSQSQLNTLTGNIFANKNAIYPAIEAELSGNFKNLDIAPLEAVGINISTGTTTRNIAINAPYLVDSLSWKYSAKNKILIPNTTLISLVNGTDGTTVTIPDVPDGGGYGGFLGGFNFNPQFGGGMPPFFNTLSNLSIWKGNGNFAADVFDVPLTISSVPFVRGTDIVSNALGFFPTMVSTGIYSININFQITSAWSVAQQSTFIVRVNGTNQNTLNYGWATEFGTKTFQYTNFYSVVAGSSIDVMIVVGSAFTGTFTVTLQKVFVS